MRGLAPKIAPLVYATNPANIAAAIDSATRISTGFEINTGSTKVNQIEEKKKDEIAELREQIANLALVEQIKAEKQKMDRDNWNGRTNWNNNTPRLNQPYEQTPSNNNYYQKAICGRCNQPEHIARECQERIPPTQYRGTQRGGNRGGY